MIPKFLYRIEFYLILTLFTVVTLQLTILENIETKNIKAKKDYAVIDAYVIANKHLRQENFELEELDKTLNATIEKLYLENEELIEKNYQLEVYKTKEENSKRF